MGFVCHFSADFELLWGGWVWGRAKPSCSPTLGSSWKPSITRTIGQKPCQPHATGVNQAEPARRGSQGQPRAQITHGGEVGLRNTNKHYGKSWNNERFRAFHYILWIRHWVNSPGQSLGRKEEPGTSCDYPLWTAVQNLQLNLLPGSFLPAWMDQICLR